MLGLLRMGIKVAHALGPNSVWYRLWYACQKKTGYFRWRTPARAWQELPLSKWLRPGVPSEPKAYTTWRNSRPIAFFFRSAKETGSLVYGGFTAPVEEAESILGGEWRYFSGQVFPVGFPPIWNRNPLTGEEAPLDRHWSQLGDFDYGDIKLVWEASRFGVVYPLVRAYAATRDDRYAEAFWQLVEDWAQKNSPNVGPHWMSGQEVAFRIMAWCFGLFGLTTSPHTTPERIARLAAMIAVQAERIAATLGYGRSQKNNHILSEAVALWTIGLLFPEFRQAARWRDLGRGLLEQEVRWQVYNDGSYVQHSVNYHRVMMEVLLWSLRLGELNGERLSCEVYDRLARATEFLAALTSEETGQAPNYGSNDGTLVLPLTQCVYSDFRPVLQACHYLLHSSLLYPPGDWDEELVWLFGPTVLETSVRRSWDQREVCKEFPVGGYYLMSGQTTRAMIRCARYRNRPGQADQLHFDLWLRGVNVACDAGTYLYNGEPPWDNGLARTVVHNTVTVDGRDQMTRASRFLWLDWAQGQIAVRATSQRGELEYWEGEHDGYRSLGVVHRRSVIRAGEESWIVVDDLLGEGNHSARLHWLLTDCPFEVPERTNGLLLRTAAGSCALQVVCSQPATVALVRAGEVVHGELNSGYVRERVMELLGWISRHYGRRDPALSLSYCVRGRLPLRFVTVFSGEIPKRSHLHEAKVSLELDEIVVRVQLAPLGQSPILQQAGISGGGRSDQLVSLPLTTEARAGDSLHVVLIHQAFTSPAEAGGTRHYELARRLVKLGCRFTVVAGALSYLTGKPVEGKRGFVTDQNLEGVRILRAYTYPSLHKSYVWRVVSFLSFMLTSVVAALRAGAVDVVLGTSPPLFQGVSAWIVAVLRRRPFVLEIRDLWPEFAIEIGVLRNRVLIRLSRWLEGFLYARAKHIIVNSPAYRDYLLRKGIMAEKVSLIPNGVDPEMFDPEDRGESVRRQFKLDGKFVVTYTGALGLANDIDTILRAANRLRETPEIHFLLVGDGKERSRLEAQARFLQLANVTFAGPQPKTHIPEILAASDACVATLKDIPLFRTTYPNKVFDYMAAGRPTILAIDGVIRQVIEAAGGGLFVPPGHYAKLAEAILTLSQDRDAARAMGTAARAYVIEHFHRQKQAEELAALITRVAKTAARTRV